LPACGCPSIFESIRNFLTFVASRHIIPKTPECDYSPWLSEEAYLFSNGSTVNIDGRKGGQSSAFGINNNGEVTGSMSTGTCGSDTNCQNRESLGDTHAFTYTGTTLKDIGTLGGNFSEGRGINNAGEITGGSNTVAGGPNHVFLYRGGALQDLGQFRGFSSEGTAINESGEIIGTAIGTGGGVGFLYSGGAFHDLPSLPGGTYSIPAGINKQGDVVGTANISSAANVPTHAFLYTNGVIKDLNNLVDSSLTLLTSATGINDKGQIVASGLDGHLYLLTPGLPKQSVRGDWDGNGVPDLYWQQDGTNAPAAWYMGGADGSTILRGSVLRGPQPGWRIVGIGDLNRDGVPDLIWQQDGTNIPTVWYMGGDGNNTVISAKTLGGGQPGWRIVGIADLDGDGYLDLYWQQDGTNVPMAWYMGGEDGSTVLRTAVLRGP
jgi:probable HAF family extracellular repeat protein